MSPNSSLPPLGFLAVEVNVHRPPGDPFNEKTWDFPLIRETVSGTGEAQIVTNKPYDDAFIDRFVEAGKKLAERGAVGIITSCGFLALAQRKLSARLPIPIATSSLLQIPTLRAIIAPDKMVGVMTYDASRLTDAHFLELGIDPKGVAVCGAPDDGHLRDVIARGAEYDAPRLQRELIQQAQGLLASHPDIAVLVLECTNMAPYGEQIHEATGIPVYDVFTLGRSFYSGTHRRNPAYWQS